MTEEEAILDLLMPKTVNKRPKIASLRMTSERILHLTKLKGEFRVSWRYRDDSVRNICRKLVAKGRLKRKKSPPGADVFVLAM